MNPCLQMRGIPPNACFFLSHYHTHTDPCKTWLHRGRASLFIAGETSASHVTPDLPGRAL